MIGAIMVLIGNIKDISGEIETLESMTSGNSC